MAITKDSNQTPAFKTGNEELRDDTKSPDETNTPKAQNVGTRKVPTETSKSEKPERTVDEDETPQSYVWLANGDVKRCNDEDLPESGGSLYGHWQEGNKVHQIVAVYPVETTLKG